MRSRWRSECCILVGKIGAQKSHYSFLGSIGHKDVQFVDDDGLRNLRCDHAGDPCGAACGHEENYRMEQGAPDV